VSQANYLLLPNQFPHLICHKLGIQNLIIFGNR